MAKSDPPIGGSNSASVARRIPLSGIRPPPIAGIRWPKLRHLHRAGCFKIRKQPVNSPSKEQTKRCPHINHQHILSMKVKQISLCLVGALAITAGWSSPAVAADEVVPVPNASTFAPTGPEHDSTPHERTGRDGMNSRR
jgi:hypothetical protein